MSTIQAQEFSSINEEFFWIAKEANSLINLGACGSDIAIISRNHKDLELIAKFLQVSNLDVNYEKQNNVLEAKEIRWLILILKFIHSVNQNNAKEQENLLPEILSLPFFNISKNLIYEISVLSHDSRLTWLNTIDSITGSSLDVAVREFEINKLKKIKDLLIDLGVKSNHLTAEQILDEIMGINLPIESKGLYSDEENLE